MYFRHRVLRWSPVSGAALRMASSFLRMRPLALGARGSPAADRLPALQRSGSLAGALPQAPAPVDCSTTWFPGKRFSNWRRGRRLPEDRFTNAAPSTDQSDRSTRARTGSMPTASLRLRHGNSACADTQHRGTTKGRQPMSRPVGPQPGN